MNKNYIIKNGPAYFMEGSNFHNIYSFDKDEAARFTDFGAELQKLQMANWRGDELEVIEI